MEENAPQKQESTPKLIYSASPGALLRAILEDLNTTPEDMAHRTGINTEVLVSILHENQPLTQDMADKLARVTPISSKTWMNFEHSYQEFTNQKTRKNNHGQ